MATAPRQGLNVARKIGSGPFNGSVSSYALASGYSTALAVGDLVKLVGTGANIEVGANSAYNLGVVQGFKFVDPNTGYERIIDYWPASQTSTGPVEALVVDDPSISYTVICNSPIGDMAVGLFYPLTLSAPNSLTRRSTMQLNNIALTTGSLAITGTNNAALTNLENGDAFAVSTSVNTTPVTITIITNQTPAQLLALLNAVPGITASLNASTHYLTIATNDGGSLILTDGAGTPLADSNTFLGQTTSATITASVAKSASAVKVIRIIDTVNNVVEVCLSNQELQANR